MKELLKALLNCFVPQNNYKEGGQYMGFSQQELGALITIHRL